MDRERRDSCDHKLNQHLHQPRLVLDNEFWVRTNLVVSKVGGLVLLVNLFICFWAIRYLEFYNAFVRECPSRV